MIQSLNSNHGKPSQSLTRPVSLSPHRRHGVSAKNRSESARSTLLVMSGPLDAVTVSAPGKVLLTGGYLVLDPQYAGSVLSVSARFHSRIVTIVNGPQPTAANTLLITVLSPQVSAEASEYLLSIDGAQIQLTQRYTRSHGHTWHSHVSQTKLITP
jgi:hypothetical protein